MRKSLMLPFLFLATSGLTTETKPKFFFEIPVYPGMEQLTSPPQEFAMLYRPEAIVERIYKTGDGSKLNADVVIAFYRKYYERKGWKVRGKSPISELRMHVDLSETFINRTFIQVSGDFYLLVAPKDGMLITFLRQWRHADPEQAIVTRMSQILSRLDVLVKRLNYSKTEVASGGPWEAPYFNEYLIDWKMFDLRDNSVQRASCINPEGMVTVQMMTYPDAEIAKIEEQKYQDKTSRRIGPNRQSLPVQPFGYREIIRKYNFIILIHSPRGDRREVVRRLAAGLRDA